MRLQSSAAMGDANHPNGEDAGHKRKDPPAPLINCTTGANGCFDSCTARLEDAQSPAISATPERLYFSFHAKSRKQLVYDIAVQWREYLKVSTGPAGSNRDSREFSRTRTQRIQAQSFARKCLLVFDATMYRLVVARLYLPSAFFPLQNLAPRLPLENMRTQYRRIGWIILL